LCGDIHERLLRIVQMSASDHEILREPTPLSATPFSVTITSPGALGGPIHSNYDRPSNNMHGKIQLTIEHRGNRFTKHKIAINRYPTCEGTSICLKCPSDTQLHESRVCSAMIFDGRESSKLLLVNSLLGS
jgi:hypothetical protein